MRKTAIGYGVLGTAQVSPNDPERATELLEIVSRHRQTNARFATILDRLKGVQSRLSGSGDCEELKGRPERPGLIGSLHDENERYDELLSELQAVVDVMENIA